MRVNAKSPDITGHDKKAVYMSVFQSECPPNLHEWFHIRNSIVYSRSDAEVSQRMAKTIVDGGAQVVKKLANLNEMELHACLEGNGAARAATAKYQRVQGKKAFCRHPPRSLRALRDIAGRAEHTH
ncbi:hypothetical protein [Pseudomonas putida]